MKGSRQVGPVKSSPRIPVSAHTNEHSSALAAFEQWQRESPHASAIGSTEDRAADPGERNAPLKN